MASPNETAAPADVADTHSKFRGAWLTWLGLLLLLLVVTAPFLALPLWVSVSYRRGVSQLHTELGSFQPTTAELVDQYIDACFDELAPASIRVFQPTGDNDASNTRLEYANELIGRGFGTASSGGEVVYIRERDDSLDSDDVTLRIDEDAGTLTVIADVYDIDMVSCLPLTGDGR